VNKSNDNAIGKISNGSGIPQGKENVSKAFANSK
jgi:hypothetical protein